MSRSIAYLTSRVNFIQVSDEIPVTKQRNPEKVDPPDVFEGSVNSRFRSKVPLSHRTEPNSEQEGAGGRPHDESSTDRISHTVAPHTGTGRNPGTPCFLYGDLSSPTWLLMPSLPSFLFFPRFFLVGVV
jgi:hypothetical protein